MSQLCRVLHVASAGFILALVLLAAGAAAPGDEERASGQPPGEAKLPPEELNEIKQIKKHWLDSIEDGKPLGGVDRICIRKGNKIVLGQPIDGVSSNPEEGEAFRDALLKASITNPEVMAASALRGLTNNDVISNSREFRGKVIHVEGRLRRINAQSVSDELEKHGIEHLWEGWVLDRHSERPIWCIVFTELPEELKDVKQDEVDFEIEFDGYYLKMFPYESVGTLQHPHRTEEALLVLGRMPTVLGRPASSRRDPWSEFIAPSMAALVIVMLGVLGILAWSFRRGDRKVRLAVDATKVVVIPERIPDSPEATARQTEQGELPPDWMNHPP
jgi:hypothetical protein